MLGAVRAAVVLGMVMMSFATASAEFVAIGTDFLVTRPDTEFDFGSLGMPLTPGFVPLLGNPAAGGSDTAISRLEPAIIDEPTVGGPASDTIDIEIVALSLLSVDPVEGTGMLSGSFFDVFVDLDPSTPSTGTMTINHELDDRTGSPIDTMLGSQPKTGTWSTEFTLNLIFTLVDVNAFLADIVIDAPPLVMIGSGDWTHGPDGEFLLGPIVEEHVGGAGTHVASQVPLPAAVWLGSEGLLAVIVFRRRKRNRGCKSMGPKHPSH